MGIILSRDDLPRKAIRVTFVPMRDSANSLVGSETHVLVVLPRGFEMLLNDIYSADVAEATFRLRLHSSETFAAERSLGALNDSSHVIKTILLRSRLQTTLTFSAITFRRNRKSFLICLRDLSSKCDSYFGENVLRRRLETTRTMRRFRHR